MPLGMQMMVDINMIVNNMRSCVVVEILGLRTSMLKTGRVFVCVVIVVVVCLSKNDCDQIGQAIASP